jgi:hypothetical protein
MTRAASKFLRILNQIEKDLKTITVANGYVTELIPDAISLLPCQMPAITIFPMCFITYKGKTVTELQNSRGVKKTKQIRLIFFLRDSSTKPTIKQIADLETDLDVLWRKNNPTLKEVTETTQEELVTKIKMIDDAAYKVSGMSYEVWIADFEVTFHENWT